jgi:hypothetical protein
VRSPRSLADELRGRGDDELVQLLAARPDLLNPVPSDLAALAARAATRPSVQRALDHLDLFALQVLEALVALPDGTDPAALAAAVGAEPRATVDRLHAQALVHGDPARPVVLRTVRELVGSPAGLGPPAVEALLGYGPARLAGLAADLGLPAAGDPVADAGAVADLLGDTAALAALLDGHGEAERSVLDRLARGPATGRFDRADREVRRDGATAPLDRLLATGLLVAVDDRTVVLPREVGLHLRGGRVHRQVSPSPPVPPAVPREPAQVDAVAGGAAGTALRLVEDLLRLWSTDPPRVLRAGGLGVRDRSRAAAALDLADADLSLLVEVVHEAGLLAAGGEADESWLPTPAYDSWLAEPPAERWLVLARSWLGTTRVPSLADQADGRDRKAAPLGPELDRVAAPRLRRATLAVLADVPGSAAPEDVAAVLAWHAPRRDARDRDHLVRSSLREAEVLGVTGRGALSGPARALLGGDAAGAAAALAAHLPPLLDHVLLQADLTAVAPGPLTSELAGRLRLAADVESTGGATVYRFTASSVRRALDAGWTSADVLDLLDKHSRTAVPQPLRYLVEDVARRHGRVRVGTASAYVRCEDPATLDELLAQRPAAALRLRRLAPTVLAAQSPVDVVLTRLRELGYAPAAEGEGGDVVVRRPEERRARPPRRRHRPREEAPDPRPALVDAAVRALRAGERAAAAAPRREDAGPARSRLPGVATADVLAMLTEAVTTGSALWIGYVDAEGHGSQRVIEPMRVEGGQVRAFDHLRDEVRTFAVHRITGVASPEPPEG